MRIYSIPWNRAANEAITFDTMMGFAGSEEQINSKVSTFTKPGYIADKFVEAEELADSFTSDIKTHTSAGKFDQYIEQCYLETS